MTLQLRRLVSRLPTLVFVPCTMIVPSARAQGFHTREMAGVYDGTLQCASAHHETAFKLSLTATGEGSLAGVLTFDAQDAGGTHPVTYSLTGTNAGAAFQISPVKWETPAPARRMIMTSSGAYDVNTWFGLVGAYDIPGTISGIESGIVINPACRFAAKRSKAASADGDPGTAATKEGMAASLPPGTRYYFCSGYSSTNQYFSDTFTGPPNLAVNKVRDDFARFLREKYSLPTTESGAGCGSGARSLEESNSAKVKQADRSPRKPVETGWKPRAPLPTEDRH